MKAPARKRRGFLKIPNMEVNVPGSTGQTYDHRSESSSEDERAALVRKISDLRRGKVGRLVDLRHAGKLPASLHQALKYLVVIHAHIIPPPNASVDQGDRYVSVAMVRWAAKRGMHLSPEDVDHIEDAAGSQWMYAGQVGRILELTDVERQRLKFWPAYPVDVLWDELVARRRKKNRERQARRRRARGVVPRAEYLESAKSNNRPWEYLSLQRRTFYRKLKAGEVTQVCHGIYFYSIAALHTCVRALLAKNSRRRSASEADPDAKAAPLSNAAPSAARSVLTRQPPIADGAIAAGLRWRAALIIARREPVRAAAMVAAEIDHLIHNERRAA